MIFIPTTSSSLSLFIQLLALELTEKKIVYEVILFCVLIFKCWKFNEIRQDFFYYDYFFILSFGDAKKVRGEVEHQ